MYSIIEYLFPCNRLNRGRNGYFAAHGIAINREGDDEISFTALSSKGESEAARIVVPVSRILDLIEELKKFG